MLGSGTSVGVPMIGCHCPVCTSTDPRNARTRSSVLLQFPAGNLLIDTTPELRLQLLREKIDLVHALVYTHYHADHLFGLDDARVFPRALGGPLPIYCTDDVEAVIRTTFSYAFHADAEALPPGVLPKLEFRRITDAPFVALGEPLIPIPMDHGRFKVFGFRIGNLAYCTDVSFIPESSWSLLAGIETFIIDALRPFKGHPSHYGLPQAIAAHERLKPRRTILTHMSHEMDYAALRSALPAGVEPGYDGLRLDF
jgi:phosphoribosyl 1,2-cyclic phosphate phosphodiesterase